MQTENLEIFLHAMRKEHVVWGIGVITSIAQFLSSYVDTQLFPRDYQNFTQRRDKLHRQVTMVQGDKIVNFCDTYTVVNT